MPAALHPALRRVRPGRRSDQWVRRQGRLPQRRGPGGLVAGERGDVPGWVLVTAMTVALVLAVWAIASQQITEIVRAAFEQARFT